MPSFSTKQLVICLTFLAVFAMAARISVDTDTWWHLRAGQWIVENRAVLKQDHFSYTLLGEKWQYPGWLVEVPMYAIYQAFGPGGLNMWTAAMVALTFWFVWKTLFGGEFLRAFVIILATAASGVFWAARPNLMTFLLTGVFLWILEESRMQWHAYSQQKETMNPSRRNVRSDDFSRRMMTSVITTSVLTKRIWLLPVLMVLWANSHGGFAVGLILWGVYYVSSLFSWLLNRMDNRRQTADDRPRPAVSSQRVKTLSLVGVLMVLAVCVNPSGPVMLLYPFKTVGIDVLRQFIQEWQSPNFHDRQLLPFLMLVLLTIGALGVSRKRISLVDFLLLTGFMSLSLTAGRNIALFAVVAPMVLTRHAISFLQETSELLGIRRSTPTPVRTSRWQSTLNWTLLGIFFLAVAVKSSLVIPNKINEEHFEETLPVAAVEFIKDAQPRGNLFNSYNWGAYLLWTLPEYPVFVDGRTDLYGDVLIGQWIQVVQADDDWEKVLDQWGVNVILLEPFRPVVHELERTGWQLLYEDEIAVIFGR